MTSGEYGLPAAAHLLGHPELVERARPYLHDGGVDWRGLWQTPPWSTREQRVIRAAADLCGHAGVAPLAPITLSELADARLWDPGPYSRTAEDHSHRVLKAMAMAMGMSPGAAERWLTARYDAVARAMDVWDWGALPTEVDAPTHILSSRRLAARTEKHLYFGKLNRVFESLAAEEWTPGEAILIDAARALDGRGPGPTLCELVTSLEEEELASVVEAIYISQFE